MDKTAQFNGTVAEILKKSDVDQAYNSKSENAQSGKAVASALGNYLPIDREIEIELDGGDAGGNVEIEFVVDNAMSDTSSNPVENRIVKQYIDAVDNKAADYIVEEGTETITQYSSDGLTAIATVVWNYCKRKGGRCELFGKTRRTVEIPNEVGKELFRSAVMSIKLPFNVWDKHTFFDCSDVNAWASTAPDGDNIEYASFVLWRRESYSSYEYEIIIHAEGRWKEV